MKVYDPIAKMLEDQRRLLGPYESVMKLVDAQNEFERYIKPYQDAMKLFQGATDPYSRLMDGFTTSTADLLRRYTEAKPFWQEAIESSAYSRILKDVERWKSIGDAALGPTRALLEAQKAIENQFPLAAMNSIRSEWQRAMDAVKTPAWDLVMHDALAGFRANMTAAEMLRELADAARDQIAASEPAPPGAAPRRLGLFEWMTIIGLLLTVLQFIRGEMLAAGSDAQNEKQTAQINQVMESATQLLSKQIQLEVARVRERRWVILDRVALVHDEPNGKRIGALAPGVEVIEIAHDGKWIEVELDDKGATGWMLKKYAKRLKK